MTAPPPPPPPKAPEVPAFKPPPSTPGRGALLSAIQKGTKLRKVPESEKKEPKSPQELYKAKSGGTTGGTSGGIAGFVPTGNPMLDEIRRRQLAKQSGQKFDAPKPAFGTKPAPSFPLRKAPPIPQKNTNEKPAFPRRPPPSLPPKNIEKEEPKKPSALPTKPTKTMDKPPSVPPRREPPAPPVRRPPPPPPKSNRPELPGDKPKRPAPSPPGRRQPPLPPRRDQPPVPTKPSDDGKFETEGRFRFRTDLPPPPPFRGIKKVYRGQKSQTKEPVQSPVIPPPQRRAPPPPTPNKPTTTSVNPDELIKKLDEKMQEYIKTAAFEKCIPIRDAIEKLKQHMGNVNSQEFKEAVEMAQKLL
jgi:hypothetical protein